MLDRMHKAAGTLNHRKQRNFNFNHSQLQQSFLGWKRQLLLQIDRAELASFAVSKFTDNLPICPSDADEDLHEIGQKIIHSDLSPTDYDVFVRVLQKLEAYNITAWSVLRIMDHHRKSQLKSPPTTPNGFSHYVKAVTGSNKQQKKKSMKKSLSSGFFLAAHKRYVLNNNCTVDPDRMRSDIDHFIDHGMAKTNDDDSTNDDEAVKKWNASFKTYVIHPRRRIESHIIAKRADLEKEPRQALKILNKHMDDAEVASTYYWLSQSEVTTHTYTHVLPPPPNHPTKYTCCH